MIVDNYSCTLSWIIQTFTTTAEGEEDRNKVAGTSHMK
jgi:hypothetical protein